MLHLHSICRGRALSSNIFSKRKNEHILEKRPSVFSARHHFLLYLSSCIVDGVVVVNLPSLIGARQIHHTFAIDPAFDSRPQRRLIYFPQDPHRIVESGYTSPCINRSLCANVI
ncbi:hypothetical protein K402DRAFT_265821 [Aulographum hederae CBS 113979]|uniref:Uncharacterized protein n=1 Tax=Aulographum hederae CBS 113979 TaxID=1176131 RepID=A0A6G1GJ07_9PEZI|nr:hypothetical protein K402DRAFT_265821 [Aulographum hederae CBS 113979]